MYFCRPHTDHQIISTSNHSQKCKTYRGSDKKSYHSRRERFRITGACKSISTYGGPALTWDGAIIREEPNEKRSSRGRPYRTLIQTDLPVFWPYQRQLFRSRSIYRPLAKTRTMAERALRTSFYDEYTCQEEVISLHWS